MKIFYSWQSDRPNALCRSFIKAAIEQALTRVGDELQLEESKRPEIDHDTKGEPGIADITNTILKKIADCSVFVGDITPISKSESGKEVANPNVLIELGYALHAKGPEYIILIANKAFGAAKPEKLPFNIRHRRGPITYFLPKGSDENSITIEKETFTDALVDAFKVCISKALSLPPVKNEALWHTSRLNDSSVWFEQNTPLKHQGFHGAGSYSVYLAEGTRSYIRLLPHKWLPTQSRIKVSQAPNSIGLFPFGRWVNGDGGLNSDGYLMYSMEDKGEVRSTHNVAQFFQGTGEIWGIDSNIANLIKGKKWIPLNYAMEQWTMFLERSIGLYKHLEAPSPIYVRIGMYSLTGSTLSNVSRDAIDDAFEYEDVLNNFSSDEKLRLLSGLLNKFISTFGVAAVDTKETEKMIGALITHG